MIDLSENRCYLTVVRPPAKSVKHCLTGSCEIVRVSFDSDHTSLCKNQMDAEYSIKHSKVLKSYKDNFPYHLPYQLNQADSLINSKAIASDKEKFYVSKILRELHCTIYASNLI